MPQTVNAPTPITHHLDHPELLLLDGAVTRVTERYVVTRRLSESEIAVLQEYGEDVTHMLPDLFGPARDFAEQIAALARTVLESATRSVREGSSTSYAAA